MSSSIIETREKFREMRWGKMSVRPPYKTVSPFKAVPSAKADPTKYNSAKGATSVTR